MRDVISNETVKEINKVIDEILTNIDDNVRNIVGAGNYSLPTIFSYTNYSGQTVSVHGSTFRHEIIIDNADGNNLIGDICTVIGDRNGIKLAKAGVENRHDAFANYWDSSFDIAYDSDTAINGYVFDMQSGFVGEGTGQSKVMSFKLDNLEVGKAYTLTFRGKFVNAQFVSGQESLVRICSTTAETPYLAQVTLEKDTDAHIYRIDFTNNTQDTTLYLNFWFYGVADDTETYHSEFIADDLIIAGMNIGIISRYIDYNGKWYPIEAGGGTSDLDAIELTYAEYQALTPDEKTDPDKIYFITDYPASVGALNDLSDVDITTPTEGQILTYDDTDDEWKNTDVDDIAPTVTEASTRANIATGDTLKTIIGKIKKWFSDLKDLAFTAIDGAGSTKYLRGDGTWQAFPTIPTVNNGTLTIKRNNTSVGTFTANQSSASNINIECATPSDVEGSKTATGSIVTVTDAADIYAEEVDVAVECTQTGSGTPSPSNIRPIQGYDIVSVDSCGKNLFGDIQYGYTIYQNEITANVNCWMHIFKCDGETELNVKIFDKGSYGGSFNAICSVDGINFDSDAILSVQYPSISNGYSTTVTIPSEKKYIAVYGYMSGHGSSHYINTSKVQISFDSIGNTYEPYNGQTITCQLGNKNLLPMTVEGIKAANSGATWNGNTATINGVTFTILIDKNGLVTGIKANGTTNASYTMLKLALFQFKANTQYTINGCPSGGSASGYSLSVYQGGSTFDDFGSGKTGSYASDENKYVVVYIDNSGYTVSNQIFTPMIRDANVSDSTFSPYNPTLGGMVYGGQLTIKDDGSAVFVGDRACVDLGSLEWNMPVSGGFSAQLTLSKSGICSLLCSVYGYDDSVSFAWNKFDTLSDKTIFRNNSQTIIYCKDTTYTDATAFKTAVIGQQLVYKLATPFTIHLSAEQLKLLQGTNNVWSNAGDVTLKYQPDNVIAEPKADVQRLRDDLDDRLVGNACINRWNFDDYLNYCKTVDSNLAWTKNGDEYSINNIGYLINAKYSFSDVDYPVAISIKMKGNATSCYILGYDINGTEVKRVNVAINANTFTDIVLTANCSKVLISYGGSGGSVIIKNPQIEIGSSPSAYEEYYPSNRELAEKIDEVSQVLTTTDNANYNTALNISAYDAIKPIFGYVSVISNLSAGANFYIPFSFMKDVVPAGTHNLMAVQGAFRFMFEFTDSPRSIKMVQALDGNGNDATTNNTIKFYLYRNY